MAQEIINVGAAPNDGTGDPIRTSFTKTNNNFSELYSRVQGSPPVTLTGSVGDTAGMISYDDEYFYYCFANFDGSSIIWNQVPNAANTQVTMLTASGNITGAYFFGDGSGLSNVPAGAPTSVQNGNSNIIVQSSGNITFSATGQSNIVTITNLASGETPQYGMILAGQLYALGNLRGYNLNVGGNATANNIISNAAVIAAGNISGANLSLTGNITSATNLSGNLTVAGNASIVGSIVGNANVTGNISGGNITGTGQITTVGNITTSGGYFIGDGGLLSNVTVTSNVAVTQIANGTTVMAVEGSGGNITIGVAGTANVGVFTSYGANIIGNLGVTANIISSNIDASSTITATGNITGGNLRTGGSILAITSITGGTLISQGNANVTANVNASNVIASSLVTATGNVTGGNLVTAGNVVAGNLVLTGTFAIGNLSATDTITSNTITANGNISGNNVIATANIVGGNLVTGAQVVASGNITGGNFLSSGLINISGSLTSAGLLNINSGGSPNAIVNSASNAVGNIGASTKYFNAMFADSFNGTTATLAGNISAGNISSTNGITSTGNISAGNLTTAGTANIGTLEVTGNVSFIGNVINSLNVGSNITGNNLITNSQFIGNGYRITSINASNVSGTVATATTAGTVTTAAQPNITSVGTLSSLDVTANITGGNLITAGLVSLSSITKTGSNAVGNIGSSSNYFNTVFAQATSALYADLAEKYLADADYEPGTVLSFGGSQELTQSQQDSDVLVAGVVSTKPAYQMNSALEGPHVVVLALVGRVPCRVRGPVTRGAMIVSAGNGLARAESNPAMGTVIGKALEDFTGDQGIIEIVVGRL